MARCPDCGASGDGSFCRACGASLEPRPCGGCGAEVPAGSRFCTQCGLSVHPPASGAASSTPAGTPVIRSAALGWWIAGILLVGLVVAVAAPRLVGGPASGPPAASAPFAAGSPLGPTPNVDLASMTPREAADRLWNRVMRAAEAQDSMEILNFLPMAVSAYEVARPLDADGTFHLSVLLRLAQDQEAAIVTAEEVLSQEPRHLLNLAAAAEAAGELGQTEAARSYWERFLSAYDGEVASGREEYLVHSDLLPRMREDARAYLEVLR